MRSTGEAGFATAALEAGDVATLARLAELPIPEGEVEAVVAPLQAMHSARTIIDGWRAEGTHR